MKRHPLYTLGAIYSFILCSVTLAYTQDVEIHLNNPSFEDYPRKGSLEENVGIKGWYDCGLLNFPVESPPDLHPINAWEVSLRPSDGNTYLGMVVRENETWESVSQRLSQPIEGGKCYSFSIDLVRSVRYMSGTRRDTSPTNYNDPAVLRIWGGTGMCGKQELLGESVTVKNSEWRSYEFEFRPERTVSYIMLEAFYKVPNLFPYNGHLLIDNASTIKEIPCDATDIPETEAEIVTVDKPRTPKKRAPEKTAPAPVSESLSDDYVAIAVPPAKEPEEKTSVQIPELKGTNFHKGQIIRINSIYFAEDTYRINESSSDALDQVYEFMKRNKDLVIEVGGHTSTGPPTKYCDALSSNRAKAVARYIAKKGISTKRLYYKGYGKRKPVIANDRNNKEAKRKNQRVEIKVLMTGYAG